MKYLPEHFQTQLLADPNTKKKNQAPKSEIPTGLSGRDTFGLSLPLNRRWAEFALFLLHFSLQRGNTHTQPPEAQFLRFSLSTTQHCFWPLLLDSTFSRLREEKFSFTRGPIFRMPIPAAGKCTFSRPYSLKSTRKRNRDDWPLFQRGR